MNILEVLTKNIRIQLAIQNMSQHSLSRVCGLTYTSINNVMNRKTVPNLNTIDKIAKGLNVKVVDLFKD